MRGEMNGLGKFLLQTLVSEMAAHNTVTELVKEVDVVHAVQPIIKAFPKIKHEIIEECFAKASFLMNVHEF